MRLLSAAMSEILAANVKTLRLSRSQNQTEFGEAVGASQGTVARWERGAAPKHEPLVKMAEMAGVSVADFTSRLLSSVDAKAPSFTPQTQAQTLYLPVTLPSESALTDMFDALLGLLAKEKSQDAVARRLAQLLPSALAQTVSRISARVVVHDGPIAPEEGAPTPSTTNPSH